MSSHRASRSPASAGESGAPPPSYQPERANLPTRVPRSHASPSMIGPPPSFYDPNQAVVPEGPDYNQWVMENYGGGGGQYAYAQGGAMSGNVPFQQQQPPQSQLHHVAVPPPPQNQYNFVQEQYAPDVGASYDSHLVQNAADRPHRGLPATRISRRGGAAVNYPAVPQLRVPGVPPGPYQQSQQSPPHGQPPFGPANESYFYAGEPQPQQQQQQPPPPPQQQHSSYNFVGYQPEQYASASSYTPSSDFTTLPSSVSTPSVGGTDDGHTHAYPLASQHPSQHPQASSSSRPTGSAARGRGRGGKAMKRARVEGALGDGVRDVRALTPRLCPGVGCAGYQRAANEMHQMQAIP